MESEKIVLNLAHPIHFMNINSFGALCGYPNYTYITRHKPNVTCETCKARLEYYVDDEKVITFLDKFIKEIALSNVYIESFEDRTELRTIHTGLNSEAVVPTGQRTLIIKYVDKQ